MNRILVFALAGPLLGQLSTAPNGFVLRGGTIHTISGPVIENGSILIRDGKIIGVGKDLAVPEGSTVIDIAGQQVYPGMIDSASTLGLNDAASGDAAENGLLNPQLRALNAVNPASDPIGRTRENGVTSVMVMPDGPLISGQLSLMHMDGFTNPEMSVLPSAAIHLHFPAIETVPIIPHEALEEDEEPKTAVEVPRIPYAEAKQKYNSQLLELNTFFDEARQYWKTVPHAIPNLKFEAMIPVFEGKTPMFVTAVREREIREAIAFADNQHIRIILADPYEAYKVLDVIKAHDIPVVLGPTMSLPLDLDDDYDRSFTTPAALFQAGIKFSIASFSSTLSRNLPYQAAAAVAYGLPHDEAYKAVSLNAAEIFGVSKRLGSIEEGKIADLIVTDGDPMEASTKVKQVFIGGKPVDLKTRQQRLYEKYLARP